MGYFTFVVFSNGPFPGSLLESPALPANGPILESRKPGAPESPGTVCNLSCIKEIDASYFKPFEGLCTPRGRVRLDRSTFARIFHIFILGGAGFVSRKIRWKPREACSRCFSVSFQFLIVPEPFFYRSQSTERRVYCCLSINPFCFLR